MEAKWRVEQMPNANFLKSGLDKNDFLATLCLSTECLSGLIFIYSVPRLFRSTVNSVQCDQMRRFCAISAIFDFDRREKFWSKRGALTLKIRRFSCLVGCFGTAY